MRRERDGNLKYRYQPPKSSVWGHSLRNMKPARERELFQEFLRVAVAEYTVAEGSLSISSVTSPESARPAVEHFERVLKVQSYNGFFPKLSEPQMEVCFQQLVSDERLYLDQHALLLQPFIITKWLIDGSESKTKSRINLNYGSMAVMSTFLYFESTDEFHYIRKVLETLKLCRLNEKHLKLEK